MDIKYLGFATERSFVADDFKRHGVKGGKAVTFTQGEGSIQTVTKEVGEYLLKDHGTEFAEVSDDNRDLTNESDTSHAPSVPAPALAGATEVVPTGDDTTAGDDTIT